MVCAIAAPWVALRAAVWSSRAGRADQNGLQNLTLAEEHYSQDVAKVDQDVRVYGSYSELENGVIVLRRQGDQALRAHHRRLALRLYGQAQVSRSLAAGLRQGTDMCPIRALATYTRVPSGTVGTRQWPATGSVRRS